MVVHRAVAMPFPASPRVQLIDVNMRIICFWIEGPAELLKINEGIVGRRKQVAPSGGFVDHAITDTARAGMVTAIAELCGDVKELLAIERPTLVEVQPAWGNEDLLLVDCVVLDDGSTVGFTAGVVPRGPRERKSRVVGFRSVE